MASELCPSGRRFTRSALRRFPRYKTRWIEGDVSKKSFARDNKGKQILLLRRGDELRMRLNLLETAAQIRASFLIEVREEKLNSFARKQIANGQGMIRETKLPAIAEKK